MFAERVLRKLNDYLCAVLCLITQLCSTLWDAMDCSPPGFSVHGDSPGKNTGVGCMPSSRDLPTPGIEHWRRGIYHLSHQGNSRILEWVAYPFSRGCFWSRNWSGVSCIAAELPGKPSDTYINHTKWIHILFIQIFLHFQSLFWFTVSLLVKLAAAQNRTKFRMVQEKQIYYLTSWRNWNSQCHTYVQQWAETRASSNLSNLSVDSVLLPFQCVTCLCSGKHDHLHHQDFILPVFKPQQKQFSSFTVAEWNTCWLLNP